MPPYSPSAAAPQRASAARSEGGRRPRARSRAASSTPGPAASPAAATAPGSSALPTTTAKIDPSLASTWEGKTVTLIVGANAGGGYDTWARVISRYMPKYLPGTPNMIVQNMAALLRVSSNRSARTRRMVFFMVSPYSRKRLPVKCKKTSSSEAERTRRSLNAHFS